MELRSLCVCQSLLRWFSHPFFDSTNGISNGYPIIPPTEGPFSMAVSNAIHVSFTMDDSANLMRYNGENWIPIPIDISDSVDFSILATDGEIIAGLYSGLFGSHVCRVVSDASTCINSGLSNTLAVIDGHIFVHGPNGVEVWDMEQGLTQLPLENTSVIGLTSAGVVTGEGTLLVPSNNGSSLVSGPLLPPNSDGRFIYIHNETIHASSAFGAISSSSENQNRPFLFDGYELGLGVRVPTLLIAEEGELEFGNGELLLRSDFNTSGVIEIEKHLSQNYYSLNISEGSVTISELLLDDPDLESIQSAVFGAITMEAAERFLGSEVPRTNILVDLPEDLILLPRLLLPSTIGRTHERIYPPQMHQLLKSSAKLSNRLKVLASRFLSCSSLSGLSSSLQVRC